MDVQRIIAGARTRHVLLERRRVAHQHLDRQRTDGVGRLHRSNVLCLRTRRRLLTVMTDLSRKLPGDGRCANGWSRLTLALVEAQVGSLVDVLPVAVLVYSST